MWWICGMTCNVWQALISSPSSPETLSLGFCHMILSWLPPLCPDVLVPLPSSLYQTGEGILADFVIESVFSFVLSPSRGVHMNWPRLPFWPQLVLLFFGISMLPSFWPSFSSENHMRSFLHLWLQSVDLALHMLGSFLQVSVEVITLYTAGLLSGWPVKPAIKWVCTRCPLEFFLDL